MEDGFLLPVTFNGEELEFPAQLHRYAHSFKLEVEIGETKYFFERDDQGDWRALISYEEAQTNKKFNYELLKAVVTSIEAIT